MSLFVEQLKALKTTMSSVEPKHFDMSKWRCGTVACICGHQTLFGDLTHFPATQSWVETSFMRENPDANESKINGASYSISRELSNSSHDALGDSMWAHSLYSATTCDRYYFAKNVLTEEQLKHPHLTTNSSPEDVVSYIDMILGVLNEKR
jgi:hypothetical protein